MITARTVRTSLRLVAATVATGHVLTACSGGSLPTHASGKGSTQSASAFCHAAQGVDPSVLHDVDLGMSVADADPDARAAAESFADALRSTVLPAAPSAIKADVQTESRLLSAWLQGLVVDPSKISSAGQRIGDWIDAHCS